MAFKVEIIRQYFLNRNDISCIYLFGSYASNKENNYSDVDLAVLVSKDIKKDRYTDIQIEIMNGLSGIIKREVDVVIANLASPFLKFQIIQRGIKIFDKRKAFDRVFEARAFLEYFDFYPVKNFLESNLIRKIKEV